MQRRKTLLYTGVGAIVLFFLLRLFNIHGDASQWATQKNGMFTMLSFLNVTKYPPSLLYNLITLGPAMVFLSLSEKPLYAFAKKITVFGRVPFFYYIVHLLLIHLLAMTGARLLGYHWSDMVLSTRINNASQLKGYGFNLFIVYLIWIALILLLYPLCKWFDHYKRAHQPDKRWLTYL